MADRRPLTAPHAGTAPTRRLAVLCLILAGAVATAGPVATGATPTADGPHATAPSVPSTGPGAENVTVTLDVADAFAPGDVVRFDYSISGEGTAVYVPYVVCPEFTQPLLVPHEANLSDGDVEETYNYTAVPDDATPQTCEAVVALPERGTNATATFRIEGTPTFEFHVSVCEDPRCTARTAVVDPGESITVDFDAGVDPSVSAVLVTPDNETRPLDLPATLSDLEPGTYVVVARATAPGYQNTTDTATFRVVEGDPTVAAEFVSTQVVTNVTVNRSSVPTGSPVLVTGTVGNDGNVVAEFSVDLLVDGDVVATETVTVPPGERRAVSFTHAFDAPGTHDLAVGNATGPSITVVERTTGRTTTTDAARTTVPPAASGPDAARAGGGSSSAVPGPLTLAIGLAVLGTACALVAYRYYRG